MLRHILFRLGARTPTVGLSDVVREIGVLTLLVAGVYFVRLDQPTLRGEEPRWAVIARDMVRNGDWIVPKLQGQPFLSRPPLGSWLIAASAESLGRWNEAAIRLPSAAAMLLTTLLIYAYGRRFLSPLGAFVSAAAFPTMGEVLQMGRLAETDAVFTLLVSSSLIGWHWSYEVHGPTLRTWTIGYSLAAAGALAKGPQAPAYFVAVVSIWLLLQNRWRHLCSWRHLAGIFAFLALVACWQVPYLLRTDLENARAIWFNDSAGRFRGATVAGFFEHAAVFPLQVIGCTSPWSIFLVSLLSRSVRQRCAVEPLRFLITAIAVTFPTCWLTPGGLTRYFMPLYPCLALLVGVAVEQWPRLNWPGWLSRLFAAGRFMMALGAFLALCALLGVRVIDVPPPWSAWRQSFLMLALVTAATVALVVSLRRWQPSDAATRRLTAVLACYSGLMYAGPIVDQLQNRSEPTAAAIQEFRARLRPGESIASIGPAHHLFAHYLERPILYCPNGRPWPAEAESIRYWCYWWRSDQPRMDLPFPHDEIAAISMERDRFREPKTIVVVVRRREPAFVAPRGN